MPRFFDEYHFVAPHTYAVLVVERVTVEYGLAVNQGAVAGSQIVDSDVAWLYFEAHMVSGDQGVFER